MLKWLLVPHILRPSPQIISLKCSLYVPSIPLLSSLGTQTAGSFTVPQKPASSWHLKAAELLLLLVDLQRVRKGKPQQARKLANTRERGGASRRLLTS